MEQARKPWVPLIVRLLPEQRARIKTAARHIGKQITHFIRDAAMARVVEVEGEIRVAKKFEKDPETSVSNPQGIPSWATFKSKDDEEEHEMPAHAPPTSAPLPTIVINTGIGGPATGDVTQLVDYILAAKNSIDRGQRERTVVKFLRESTSDQTEAERLAQLLDDKLAAARSAEPKKNFPWMKR